MNFVLELLASRSASQRWQGVVDLLCCAGLVLVLVAALADARAAQARRLGVERGLLARLAAALPLVALGGASAAMAVSMLFRWREVDHFPSQTMSEVLGMFTLALLLSMLVLHFALGLAQRGRGWAALDHVLIGLVLAGVLATHAHVATLSTAQRDLPPALQSYWFAPHLSSLIFSYATLGIAGLLCLVYFVTRFWCGVFGGGRSLRSQLLLLAALTLVPFVQVVTLPLLALGALVFGALWKLGRLPSRERLAGLERELDETSFRAFAVGMPFLTAGLWMGAFWAQEAWANYWGWDSKENTALITWLVYVVYIHCRMLGGYRGERAMGVLVTGALSIFLTFQLFGYLPDSQKSLHRYTDDGVAPQEGRQGPPPGAAQASLERPASTREGGASR